MMIVTHSILFFGSPLELKMICFQSISADFEVVDKANVGQVNSATVATSESTSYYDI